MLDLKDENAGNEHTIYNITTAFENRSRNREEI